MKEYNGHTYTGVLLQACNDGYEQGKEDAVKELVSKFTEHLMKSRPLTLEQAVLIIQYEADQILKGGVE